MAKNPGSRRKGGINDLKRIIKGIDNVKPIPQIANKIISFAEDLMSHS
jgi:hypothetical protein